MTKTNEERIEEFDSKFYYEHEERGLTYLRNDVVGWLRTLLTEKDKEREEAVAEAYEKGQLESRLSEHYERLILWDEAVEEGRRRERSFIVKLIDGHKVIYAKGDERFYEDAKDGEEKDHIDSCCNETIDEILQALTPDQPLNNERE